MMKYIEDSSQGLAAASRGNPVTVVFIIAVAFIAFNLLEATIEKLIFGERFEHWLDPLFLMAFIWYAIICLIACYEYSKLYH